ncbi:aminotransferase IV [Fulvivirga sp. M361]|uniref:aminotransferase class IV n=1 Tax=Fulvivirga sp. M361 TaxID=2594266 RepID=UPI001179AE7A|nr:aminotransferase class IV [Fulvivirga sp. M361]TRX60873.1 aminotransferase IV [Fulvivirga sp. M361]
MKAYFNGTWIENDIRLPLNDRGLQFGDGLFETIIVKDGAVRFLKHHLTRIQKGAEVMGLKNLPFSIEELENVILKVLALNKIDKHARVKLQIWRQPSSRNGYHPTSLDVNILVTASEHVPFVSRVIEKVSFCTSVALTYSAVSRFKTISALPYVMASKEAEEKGMDDLILLNERGLVSECIMSNIFWIKDKTIFTPSLATGCIEGIMRNHLITQCHQSIDPIIEVEAKPAELAKADVIFSANVAGFYIFQNVNTRPFSTRHPTMQALINNTA